MKHKNKKRVSIRLKLFGFFILLTAIAIAVMWLCQNVLLNDIYKSTKTSEIERASDKLTDSIGSDSLQNVAQKISGKYDICVIILSRYGTFSPISVEAGQGCVIHRTNTAGLMSVFERSQSTGDGILYFDDKNAQVGAADAATIVLVKSVKIDNDEAIIFLNSVILPVDATVRTMNTILIFVTVLLVLISALLSLILSGVIARPLKRLTQGAKVLASGKFDTEFRGGGYREADSLANSLTDAGKQLGKVDGMQKELMANISHDLRTPLTMISGYSEMMRDIPGENTPENLQIVIDETARLTSLVNDVLDISKLRSGAVKYDKKVLDLSARATVAMQRYAKLMSGGYDIRLSIEPGMLIYADETRVLQVIYNLVNNAVTYTGEDKRVEVNVKKQGDCVRLYVCDTGDGIPKEKLPDIWERYYKVDEVHKRAAIGTGLGLSIVREIMEEHGGHYGVSSTQGVGSAFWVEFKLYIE